MMRLSLGLFSLRKFTARSSALALAVLFAALAAVALPQPAHAVVIYDLAADWSDSSNPNGVWSYESSSGSVLPSVSDWDTGASHFGSAQPAWASSSGSPGTVPMWAKRVSDATFLDWPIGAVGTHGPSAVDWTSPIAGVVDITGSLWMMRDIGRSMAWTFLLNGSSISGGTLASGEGSSGSPVDYSTGSTPSNLTDLVVAFGDVITLRLVGNSTTDDFVGVNLTITADPVPEPATLLLLGTGLAGLGIVRRRRKV